MPVKRKPCMNITHVCLIQLLKTQDELERLRAEKQTFSSDMLNELQDHNISLISRVYDEHFAPLTTILYSAYGMFFLNCKVMIYDSVLQSF